MSDSRESAKGAPKRKHTKKIMGRATEREVRQRPSAGEVEGGKEVTSPREQKPAEGN